MDINIQNKVQLNEAKQLNKNASGLSSPTKNGGAKARDFRSARTEMRQGEVRQQNVNQQVKTTFSNLVTGAVNRLTNAIRLKTTTNLGGRQTADEISKEELTTLSVEHKSIEQRMAEKGPDKREIARKNLARSKVQQGIIREELRNTDIAAPIGFLDAVQESIEEAEEWGEEDSIERAQKRAKKRSNLTKDAKMARTHGQTLAKASMLLPILQKAVEKWLELMAQGKKPGPTIREMKQLSRISR